MENTQNKAASMRSFRRGLANVKAGDLPGVKAEIMQALGVTTKQSFIRYADGKVASLDVLKAREIEGIFQRHGVTEYWGEG